MFRAAFKKNIGDWSFRNRQRFVYRMFDFSKSKFRYRTDFRVKYKTNWTALNNSPYFLEELFFSKKQYSRNILYVGIEGKKGRFELGVYMVLQSVRFPITWKYRFIIIGSIIGFEL